MRHRLTDRQMLKGVTKALVNSRTPAHLRPGLKRLKQRLEQKIERAKHRPKRKDFLSEFLGI
jgi:hypothetical protein